MYKEWGDLEGVKVQCKVVKVHDGDTIHVLAPVGEAGGEYLVKCRLAGIDTPELKVDKTAKTVLQSQLGKTDGNVMCHFGKKEKYGRTLTTVYQFIGNETICLNNFMLTQGLAVSYSGGRKSSTNQCIESHSQD